MKHYIFHYCLMFTTLWLTACASTASGKKQSAFTSNSHVQKTIQAEPPAGSLYVTIRYPAVVDVDAKDAYQKAYMKSPIGGKISDETAQSIEAQNMADSTIVKSNYFALSLYKALAARLPEHTVLLSPHTITLADDGSLTSEPITKAETLPSVVTLDFTAYSFPDPKKMMSGQPLTFGDLITPLIVARTDPRASVPTHGVKIASADLEPYAAGNGKRAIIATVDALQGGRIKPAAPELDFIAYLSKDMTVRLPTTSLSSAQDDNVVRVYPVEKLQMPASAMQALNGDVADHTDPLDAVFSGAVANGIIDIIHQAAGEKSVMLKRAAAIYSYDPNLAALTFAGSERADYQARYNYVLRLLEAERKYMSVQSLRLFDGIYNGEMGAQVRDMVKAEYEILEKRRELARQQNQATALAIVGAVAAGAQIASQNSGSNYNYSYADRLLTDALISATLFSAQKAFGYRHESALVGENYLTSIVPALEQQTTIQVNMTDANETITAVRYEDLKDKLQTLYSQKQRSLDVAASRCAFTLDGPDNMGVWMGVCESGLANGAGVGVFTRPDGTVLEYYGQTENGRPHGPGYLITHTPKGSEALEGRFIQGQADGAMRLSRAGQADQIKLYRGGAESGNAPADMIVPSPFQGTAAEPVG